MSDLLCALLGPRTVSGHFQEVDRATLSFSAREKKNVVWIQGPRRECRDSLKSHIQIAISVFD